MNAGLKEYLSIGAMSLMIGFFFFLTPSDVAAGGSIFPKVLMGLMTGLALLKLASELLNPRPKEGKKEEDTAAKENRKRFWVILVSIVVYVLAVDSIGFYVSSFIFFFGLTVAVQYEKRTPRALALRLVVVTCFMVFLYVLFTKVLMAQLPAGILF